MLQPSLCRYIDHAILKPDETHGNVIAQIQAGIDAKVYSVCVRPIDIQLACDLCRDTNTKVSCVLAFPHGHALSEIKAVEAQRYIDLGVHEIDMVVNYSLIRDGRWQLVEKDILAVTDIAKPGGIVVKTILETAALSLEQIAHATEIAIKAHANFVKTSTGFAPAPGFAPGNTHKNTHGGATKEAVQTMLKTANGRIKVKASGGIRDYATAAMFIKMGVTRLGVSASTTPILCDEKDDDASDQTSRQTANENTSSNAY